MYWQSCRQDLGAVKVIRLGPTSVERIESFRAAILFRPSIVYEGSQIAKAWSGYRRMDGRSKDIEAQFHYTREAVEARPKRCQFAHAIDADYYLSTKPATSTPSHTIIYAPVAGICDTSSGPCAARRGMTSNMCTCIGLVGVLLRSSLAPPVRVADQDKQDDEQRSLSTPGL